MYRTSRAQNRLSSSPQDDWTALWISFLAPVEETTCDTGSLRHRGEGTCPCQEPMQHGQETTVSRQGLLHKGPKRWKRDSSILTSGTDGNERLNHPSWRRTSEDMPRSSPTRFTEAKANRDTAFKITSLKEATRRGTYGASVRLRRTRGTSHSRAQTLRGGQDFEKLLNHKDFPGETEKSLPLKRGPGRG